MKFAVDIPNSNDITQPMVNLIDYFETRQEAIDWAKKNLGADNEGKICVVSELPIEN